MNIQKYFKKFWHKKFNFRNKFQVNQMNRQLKFDIQTIFTYFFTL